VTDDDKHQGIVALTTPRPLRTEAHLDELADARVVLALDQISDPQNLGTILRSAAFFGVDALLVMKNRAAEVSPLVARVAVGGAELVPIFRVTNLARSLEILKGLGFWIYGLDERGDASLAQTEFDEKTVLVVGAEGEGLRHRTKQLCDALVRIPGGRAGLESLNAGVATAVALAEVFRNRDAS
jgi:23S rRNA (guanosine2251-2'-O)-methyltransferase